MSLKETYKHMRDLLHHITIDLEKAENGNKAASQRVRTKTVRLEKMAKLYRKESISSDKKNKGQRKTGKSAPKLASKSKSPAKSKSSDSHHTKSKSHHSKAKSASKPAAAKSAKSTKASVKPRQLSLKRATAKLPTKRVSL